jgi:hypothetical protein
MPILRNINPLGAIDLPLLGRTLDAGEEFEVTDDQAAVLLQQIGNYVRADDAGQPQVPAGDQGPTDVTPAQS